MQERFRSINTRVAAQRMKEYRSEIRRLTNQDKRGYRWDYCDSSLSSFEESFAVLLPRGEKLKNYVEQSLAHRAGEAIGIELGGPGSSLFSGFTHGFFKKTAGIALADQRRFFDYDPTDKDTMRNHTVIEGDILRRSTLRKIEQEFLQGEKADFIIKRMVGGDFYLPCEPFFMGGRANDYYQMLSRSRGLMLVENPMAFWDLIDVWGLHSHHNNYGLEVDVRTNGSRGGVMLRKLADAPEELPLLTVEEVREIVGDKGKYSALSALFATPS